VDLFEQVGASDGGFERWQAEGSEKLLDILRQLFKEADEVLGLPRNLARSSGFCVAIPVGQVLR